MTKIRILNQTHAVLQTILKADVKLQKDRLKTVGGVARTKCILPVHFCSITALNGLVKNAKKMTKNNFRILKKNTPSRVAQSVGHLTRKSGVLGSIPGLATYFRFTFRFFKKGSCQLLAKVCARSTG